MTRTYCGQETMPGAGRACHRPRDHSLAHAESPLSTDFKEDTMQIDSSDAQKIHDVLAVNEMFHIKRDEMNAAIHLSREKVRYSPITSEVIAARERLTALMAEQGVEL